MSSNYSAAQQAMQLFRSQFVSQLILGDGFNGLTLSDLTLGRQPARSGRDMMQDALTGLMRSDSAMMRQASRNLEEGSAITKQAGATVSGIRDLLTEMNTIAGGIADGSIAGAELATAQSAYNDLLSSIDSLRKSSNYNGISLTDKNAWAKDERVTVSPDGSSGKISIQAGNSPTNLTLYDLSFLNSLPTGGDLDTPAQAATAIAQLSEALGRTGTIEEMYKARSAAFKSEAVSFDRQSDILAKAASRAQDGGKDPKNTLLDLMLSEQGNLVDSKS